MSPKTTDPAVTVVGRWREASRKADDPGGLSDGELAVYLTLVSEPLEMELRETIPTTIEGVAALLDVALWCSKEGNQSLVRALIVNAREALEKIAA